jgi:hypothetical protein
MFAWLTTRHVGDAAFLEDQVDQLQDFESLLRLQPEGLWGAVMSGTVPPARTLGPLGAVVFGVPMALGFGVDAIAATRDGDYPASKTVGATRYLRELVLPPGIARYRRD